MNMRKIIPAVTMVLALLSAGVQAAEIRVFSSNAVKTVLEALEAEFEKASGHKIVFTYDTAAVLKTQIEKGAAFDVAILTAAGVDDLIKQGKIAAASRADLARSGAGVAIKKGAARPDISTTDAFKRTLLNAKSFGYVEAGATGIYLKNLFVKLGIADELKAKFKPIEAKVGAGPAVAAGDVEISMTQISEILPYAGAELLGPLPKEIQLNTDFAMGIAANSKEANAAGAWLKFMATPSSTAVIKAKGLEPR
jgi:molybdate transport system substrate-binding protein